MNKENIYGVFEYNGKEYPFALEGHVLSIPQKPFQYRADFHGVEFIDSLQGTTDNNQGIIFLGCKVYGWHNMPMMTGVKISVQGYIILTTTQSSFDRIVFHSEAINGFYSPRNAYDVELYEDFSAIRGIMVRDSSLYKKDFECQINDEAFTLGLNISLFANLAWDKEQLGTANSMISLSFEKPIVTKNLQVYYLYVRDFLEFVNFQKKFPLQKIELFEKTETGRYEKRGKAVIFQADSTGYVPSAMNTITFKDITSECFATLFSQVAEKRLHDMYNPFLYPESRKEDTTLDASKWLNTAICFEGEFNASFPDFRAKQDQTFREAKELLLNVIQQAVEQSGVGISNKRNKALNSFRSLISHSDTTIKQKFEICSEVYQYETNEFIRKICEMYKIPEDTDLADAYATYRNQNAHGAVRRPEKCDIATYTILRGFIYVMNLKRANVPADNIKNILSRIF